MNRSNHSSLCRLGLLLLAGIGLCLADAGGQQPDKDKEKGAPAAAGKAVVGLPESVVKSLNWRCVGPANMAGRITAISVDGIRPLLATTVATAGGGLVKTTNNGITVEHQFDKEATVSIGDVCVAPSNRNIVWVGTGENNPRNSVSYGDGVYKSTDGGKTWKNMGLKATFHIGKILIHPKNPDIVYVGALGRCYGPNKERGVYKTTDGGATWNQVLFKDDKTGVIDMAMHPTDPDTILVAMWERKRDGYDVYQGKDMLDPYDHYDPIVRFGVNGGIYKTTDGGKTFDKMTAGLPSSKTGRIGLDWYRKDPNVVFAIVDCEDIGKGPPPAKKAGATPVAGFVGEDTDAGYRIANIVDESPALKAGLRIGDLLTAINDKAVKTSDDYLKHMNLRLRRAGDKAVFGNSSRGTEMMNVEVTLAEALQKKGGGGGFGGKGGKINADRPNMGELGGQGANLDNQGTNAHEYGGVYRSDDAGKTWKRVNSLNPRPMYFSVVKVDPSDDKVVFVLGVEQYKSGDGGKTFTANAGKGVHADGHAMWIDQKDGRHMLVGCDGGFYVSYDRATNWDHLNTLALGQFYHVAMCSKKPYWLYGGLQDNGSWGIPSVGLKGRGPVVEDELSIGGGDGFVCRVDPSDPDLVYFESQDGNISRRNLRTGEKANIRPQVPGGGKGGGGKGGGGKGGGGGFGKGENPYRFNWNTPFILSHHNPKIFYSAGNFVFKSLNRGDDLRKISPEITLCNLGSATALSESPKNPDVLWVGTDDGALWVTRNGGNSWTEVDHLVPMPGPRCVATIEASKYSEGRCYVAFDAHRSNDDKPYVFVTEDFGQSWAPLHTTLPKFGSTRCLREDFENEDLLFCGTEFAVFASIDRGVTWSKINNNLPTVAVHEVAIHPTAGEIAVATHGRSLWIMDVTALRQMKPTILGMNAHLFKPNTAIRWQMTASTGTTNRKFVGTNPPPGAAIFYHLGEEAKNVTIKVLDVNGEVISTSKEPVAFQGKDFGGMGGGGGGKGGKGGPGAGKDPSSKPGLHYVIWDMSLAAAKDGKGAAKGGVKGVGGGGFGGGFGGVFGAFRPAPAGFYRIVMDVDGKEFSTSVRVEADPNAPPRPDGAPEEVQVIDPRKIR